MKLGMSLLLMIAAFCYVELTSPVRLYGEGPRYKTIDLETSGPTAPNGAGETKGSSAAAKVGASDFPYVIPNTTIASRIEILEPLRGKEADGVQPGSLQCTLPGRQCSPQFNSCCSRICVFSGGSTRVGYKCR